MPAPSRPRKETPDHRVRKVLLACGLLASLLYVAVDVFTAWRWAEYSYTSQAVSELSAIGAPTRPWWIAFGFVYSPLMLAFAWGVWRAAGDRRLLRITALLLFAIGAIGIVWSFFPMHARGGPKTSTDTMHAIFAGVQVALLFVTIGFSAAALGTRFRIFAIATGIVLLAAGASTFLFVPRVDAAVATPWMGLVERLSVYGYLVWVAGLAIALWREAEAAAPRRIGARATRIPQPT
jgi:hypothetical protein